MVLARKAVTTHVFDGIVALLTGLSKERSMRLK